MTDVYLSFGPDPSHEEGSRYLTGDAIGIARLRKSENMESEWVLTCVAPTRFEPTNFLAADQDEAERNAIGWIEANADEVLAWMQDDE